MDLRLHLTIRLVALALACLVLASVGTMARTHADVKSAAATTAERVGRVIERQLIEASMGVGTGRHYSEDEALLEASHTAGQCVRWAAVDGTTGVRSCRGWDAGETHVPHWFAWLAAQVCGVPDEVGRPVVYRDRVRGRVVVSSDPDLQAAQAWRDIHSMVGLTALTVVALCVAIYVAIGRALRPTRSVLEAFDRARQGDLGQRLPRYRLLELDRIGQGFNSLAENLQQRLAERDQLIRQLLDVEEEARRTLARELHDEFGQCLAGLSAMVTLDIQMAREMSPALVPRGEQTRAVVGRMMELLKSMLVKVRPPGIDELGLVECLRGLVGAWRTRSAGTCHFDLVVRGDFSRLPGGVSVNLYRIVQECLTNASRHAQATRVTTTLVRTGASMEGPDLDAAGIEVIVEDDGIAAERSFPPQPGLGLIGMRERVAALGGRLTLMPRPTRGLRVHVHLPLGDAAGLRA